MSNAKSATSSKLGVADKGLLSVAAVGWGLFAYSAVSSGFGQQAVQDDIARLRQKTMTITAERDKLAQERDLMIRASGDHQHIQKQIAAATHELQRLETMRARVSEAIDQTHPQLVALASRSGTSTESPTASSTASTPLSKQQIRAAQEALTDLGYGNLEADGVFGPGTSKAVEAFERARGLPVTGKLGTATLHALRTPVASAAP
jgi:murein L,D-transpeptidase YcbB/YkuD